MKFIDNFLNSITMYKLVLYSLLVHALFSVVFSFFDLIVFEPIDLIKSLVILVVVCFTSNWIFAELYGVSANVESYFITALILFFIISPPSSINEAMMVGLAGILAMASKYILAIRHTHIINPAAFGAFAVGVLGFPNVTWWVGTFALTPVIAIIGFLIVRKIRRWNVFFPFAITALITIGVVSASYGSNPGLVIWTTLISGTLIFFGTVMLTEPLTMPVKGKHQIIYGILIGILYSIPLNWGSFYLTAELSLILGNIFAFIVSYKYKYRLKLSLVTKRILSPDIYEFEFASNDPKFRSNFIPGQYMEWTISSQGADIRGNRRFFTIASSPTEENLKIGIKVVAEKSSTFKTTLGNLKSNDSLFASQVAGDFILPKEPGRKLVFIAGGIGVTPFRSMIKFLLDKNEEREIVLLYVAQNPQSFVYMSVFGEAEKQFGLKIVKVLSGAKDIPVDWRDEVGFVTPEMLRKHVPELKDRVFYISGPNGMVQGYKKMLMKEGVSTNHIKTDYFPGY